MNTDSQLSQYWMIKPNKNPTLKDKIEKQKQKFRKQILIRLFTCPRF